MRLEKLKQPLDQLYASYAQNYLSTDPLWFVHQYSDPLDQECVAFLASALAYGNVSAILKTLKKILCELGSRPASFLKKYHPSKHPHLFEGIGYRFHKAFDLRILLFLLSRVYQREHSIERSFLEGYEKKDADLGESLSRWVEKVLGQEVSPFYGAEKLPDQAPVRFFFSSPRDGSSCKRLNLFLRWMIRGPDGVDLKVWKSIPPSKLIMPVDTHIFQIARQIGLTQKMSATWKAALEITENLRKLDPQDPVKYDFALTRLGMLKICPRCQIGLSCRGCEK